MSKIVSRTLDFLEVFADQKRPLAAADHDPVVLRTDAFLRSLRDAIDESVLLSKVHGLSASYLAAFEPSHPLRFLATVGESVTSLHAVARRAQAGKGGRTHHERLQSPGKLAAAGSVMRQGAPTARPGIDASGWHDPLLPGSTKEFVQRCDDELALVAE